MIYTLRTRICLLNATSRPDLFHVNRFGSGAQNGDDASWKRLVALYSPLVYGWCRDGGLPPGDAADVLQEVFLAVWQGRNGFVRDRQGQSFRGWLRIVARNKIADSFRVRSARGAGGPQYALDGLAAPADSSTGCGSGSEQQRVRQLLDRALETVRADFEPATWRSFQLSVLQDRPTAEVAGDLGMTAAAVRQAKYKVLRRLREELGGGAVAGEIANCYDAFAFLSIDGAAARLVYCSGWLSFSHDDTLDGK